MENTFVDNTEGHPTFNYDRIYKKLLLGVVQKDLIGWCVYSISQNDEAHNLDHVLKVIRTGINLFETYQDIYNLNEIDRTIVYHALLLHDVGCRFNRKDHHLIGYGLTYEYINRYDPGRLHIETITHIAKCVMEHRSSNKTKPTSILSEIVSVADSGIPDINEYLKRALQFRLSGKDDIAFKDKDQLIKECIKHIKHKFGKNGYHWDSYPDIGKSYYSVEWDNFTNKLEDEIYLLNTLNDLYEEFKDKDWVKVIFK